MADSIEPPNPRPFLEFRPLLRALGIATDARKLILAMVGLVVLYAGWFAVDAAYRSGKAGGTSLPDLAFGPSIFAPGRSPYEAGARVTEPFRSIVAPFADLFTRGVGVADWFRSALKAAWAAVAWGIAGGAIARIAVVQAATDRRIGLATALRFAIGKSSSLIGAPLTPMLAVAILAGCCAVFGLIYRIPWGVGATVATLLGFVPLLLGLVMALILLGLALGWPLMHATIAAEGEDAPDALSRSYSYVNQRLVRYVVHALVAFVIGSLGLWAAVGLGQVVLGLSDWGVALGAPDLAGLDDLAKGGRSFWSKVVGLAILAWSYSYFWSAASLIYLILRRDVDGADWHDVYLPEHDADTFAGDPAAEAPGQGVIKESAPAATSAP